MTEVLFYHLTESTLEAALPALLEKSLGRGWRVVVETGSEERRDALDAHLWTYREDSFLAHGTDRESHAAEQPILLAAGPVNPNGARIRFFVDGAQNADVTGYERAVFMFDGHDAAQLERAREQWKTLKAAGHQATYWQQGDGGRWERQG